jgi:hypothetical protein
MNWKRMNLKELKKQVEAYPPEVRLLISLSTPGGPNGLSLEKWLADNPVNWQRFANLAASHKLVSLIFSNLPIVREHMPDEIYQQLKNQNQRFTRRSFVQTEQTIHLQELFNKEGIPAIFFKGIVLSQRLYGHPATKNSADIDLLVPVREAEKTTELLRARGYHLTYPSINLTEKQKHINYRISHHYGLHNNEKGVHLELHWHLTNPHSLLPLPFESVYENHSTIELNHHPIKTLGDENYLIYLAVHGARHQWCRLNWLKDFTSMLEKTSLATQQNAEQRMQTMGLERCYRQARLMSHLVYGVPASTEDLKTDGLPSIFIQKPVEALRENKPPDALDKLKDMPYHIRLRRRLKFKVYLFLRLRTHHTNWAIVRLPDYLFFLYYPLRPVLWVREVLRKK